MRNLYILFFLFLLTSSIGQKTLLVENFDYDAGVQIRAHGWTAHSGFETNPITVADEGLSMVSTMYAGNGIGRAALVINNGADENKPFSSWVPQPLDGESPKHTYASFLLKPNGEIPAATGTTRPYFFHFGMYSDTENPEFSSISTAFRARTFILPGTVPNTFAMNLSFNENVPNMDNMTGNYNSNNVHLVVVKYTSIAGVENDEVSLFVFKDGDNISTEPATPTIGPLKGTNADVVLQAVVLRQYQTNQNVIVDGIIVRDHWDLTSATSSVNDQVYKSNLNVFPNPVKNNIVNIVSDNQGIMEVSISDLTGKTVLDKRYTEGQVDISTLNSGLYILQVNQAGIVQTQKLVVH